MPLILAIEPDRRQAHELTAMVRGHLRAKLVLADTAEKALAALGARVPDLILTSALLSTKDETMLAEWLRTLDVAAAHVQTLTVPVLETPARVSSGRTGIFALLPERVSSPAAPDGCDPAVFAEQCAAYLERAAAERGPVEVTAAADNAAVAPHDEPDKPDAPAEETIAAMTTAPSEVPVSEPPPPPQAAGVIPDGIEIDLSGMLDEKVFQQLSKAIETVSRDSAQASAPGTRTGEVWTPSSLGSAAVWPAMDFASNARPNRASSSASTRSPLKRFPARKPIQDEWGFFDPAQCGFSALLAKLDEITHVAPALPSSNAPAGRSDLSH
jgi:hypothetical protein